MKFSKLLLLLFTLLIKSILPAQQRNASDVLQKITDHIQKIDTSYYYRFYERLQVAPIPGANADSNTYAFCSRFDGKFLFLIESIGEVAADNKGRRCDQILATKTAGTSYQNLAVILAQTQDVNLSKPLLKIKGKVYLNPLLVRNEGHYHYELKGQVLKITPKNDSSPLSSQVALSHDSQIMGISFIPIDQKNTQFSFSFAPTEKGVYFPERKSLTTDYRIGKAILQMNTETMMHEVKLNENHPHIKWDHFQLNNNKSTDQNELWAKYKSPELSAADQLTYEELQPIGAKFRSNFLLECLEALAANRFPLGFFDVDILKIYRGNDHEGLRLGFGGETNARLFKNLSLGGYFGYGFRDKKLKHGVSARYTFIPEVDAWIKVAYSDDVFSPGLERAYVRRAKPIQELLVYWVKNQKSHRYRTQIDASFMPLRGLRLKAGLDFQNVGMLPGYTFTPSNEGVAARRQQINGFRVGFRWKHGENFLKTSNGRIFSMGSPAPTIWLNYFAATKQLGSDLTFNQLRMVFEQKIKYLNGSSTNIHFKAGWADGDLPIHQAAHFKAVQHKLLRLYTLNVLEAFAENSFFASRYIYSSFVQNFNQFRMWNKKLTAPYLGLRLNYGIGSLHNPESHNGFDTSIPVNGVGEIGVTINQLIKLGKTGINIGFFKPFAPAPNNFSNSKLQLKIGIETP